jgi:hypothetical protein
MRIAMLIGEYQTPKRITPQPVLRRLKLFAAGLFDQFAQLAHDTTRANGM